MEFIHHSKRNTRLPMAWPTIIVIVIVLLLTGCAENRMSYGDTLDESRTFRRPAAETHKGSTIAPVSFIEHLWGEVWNGVTNRTRKMTGKQTPSHITSDSSWRIDIPLYDGLP